MKKSTFQFIAITAFILVLLIIWASVSFGQINRKQGYCSFSPAWVPSGDNTGYIALQLTAGRNIGKSFLEYSQTITLSPETSAAKLFQLRGGYCFDLDKNLNLRPFAGYSLSSIPANETSRVGHSACIGAALIQDIDHSDLSIKYELSINNSFLVIPSIGAVVRF